MVTYRKLQKGESQKFWDLMNQMDNETKYMLYEPGERKEKASDAERLELMIENTIASMSIIRQAVRKFAESLLSGRSACNMSHSRFG